MRKRGFEPYYEELTPDSNQTLDVKLEKSGHSGGGGNGNRPRKGEPPKKPEAGKAPKGKESSPTTPSSLPTGLRDPFKKK